MVAPGSANPRVQPFVGASSLRMRPLGDDSFATARSSRTPRPPSALKGDAIACGSVSLTWSDSPRNCHEPVFLTG